MKLNNEISSEGRMKLTIRLFMNKSEFWWIWKEEMFCSLKQKYIVKKCGKKINDWPLQKIGRQGQGWGKKLKTKGPLDHPIWGRGGREWVRESKEKVRAGERE